MEAERSVPIIGIILKMQRRRARAGGQSISALTGAVYSEAAQPAFNSGRTSPNRAQARNRAGSRSPCAAASKMCCAMKVRLTFACWSAGKLAQAASKTDLIRSIVSGSKTAPSFRSMAVFPKKLRLPANKLPLVLARRLSATRHYFQFALRKLCALCWAI